MTEARILRERQRAFLERLDRAQSDRPPFVTARRLVSIRDLGAMPTSADHMFAASPVELDGDETEGAAYTPVIDTATTLFVDVLGGVPAAGDLLTAYAVGGRWVAERRGCSTTILVACDGVPVVGASVTIKSGATTIATGTTGADGKVLLPIGSTGSYTVVVTSGSGDKTTTITLTCGLTEVVDVCFVPCGACDIPAHDLTVSWFGGPGDGSTTFVYNSSTHQWATGCINGLLYLMLCNSGTIEFRVIYFITGGCPGGTQQYCSTLGSNPFKLTRTALTCGSGFLLTADVTDAGCPILGSTGSGYSGFMVSV